MIRNGNHSDIAVRCIENSHSEGPKARSEFSIMTVVLAICWCWFLVLFLKKQKTNTKIIAWS